MEQKTFLVHDRYFFEKRKLNISYQDGFKSQPTFLVFFFFFDNQVTNYLCQQSKLFPRSKVNCVYHVTAEKFCALVAILLRSVYSSLPRRRMHWEREPDIFNCAIFDLCPEIALKKY